MARILIAEDEEALRGFVARALRLDGHETTEAGDGEEGLAQVAQRRLRSSPLGHPHADDGRHRTGATHRRRVSAGQDPADDRLRRPARARRRPRAGSSSTWSTSPSRCPASATAVSAALAGPEEARSGRSRLLHVQQALEILLLERRAQRVAQPLADLVEDLAGALDVDLVRHLDLIAEIRTRRRARPAERVAVVAAELLARAAGPVPGPRAGPWPASSGSACPARPGATPAARGPARRRPVRPGPCRAPRPRCPSPCRPRRSPCPA